jgi:hypothetical protein
MPSKTLPQRQRAKAAASRERGKAAQDPLGVKGQPASAFQRRNIRGVSGPPRASELARDTSKSQTALNRKMAQAAMDRAAMTRAGINGKKKK